MSKKIVICAINMMYKYAYIRGTEAQLLLKEPQSVVKPLHTEVKQVRSFAHHGCHSFRAELF